MNATSSSRLRRRWIPSLAIAAVLATSFACRQCNLLTRLFGPPEVVMSETYFSSSGSAVFDHASLGKLLRQHVQEGGWVDYESLAGDTAALDVYIQSLADAPFADLGRDEKLALLINAYNAFTLRLILDNLPLDSIRDIPAAERWDAVRWKLAGETYSLSQLEHEQIRPHFAEPRVHFALVCAAVGCPPLRSEPFVGKRIEEQLHDQASYVHRHSRWFEYYDQDDDGDSTAHMTSLYLWYQGDFEQAAGSPLDFASRYSEPLASALADEDREVSIEFKSYDWSLNQIGNRR